MSNIYQDGTYLELHPDWHVGDSSWKAEQLSRIIERNNLRPSSICEIGCGAGQILKELSDRMGDLVKFVGYEISQQAYELCEKRSSERLQFFHQDLLEDTDAVFDLVMAVDVVEHVEDYLGFLRKLRTKGRYKIFLIPLDISVYSVLRNYPMSTRRESGHLHYFTKDTALATLQDAGYKIVDYMFTPNTIELRTRGLMKKLLKLPRRIGFATNPAYTAKILGGFSLLVLAE